MAGSRFPMAQGPLPSFQEAFPDFYHSTHKHHDANSPVVAHYASPHPQNHPQGISNFAAYQPNAVASEPRIPSTLPAAVGLERHAPAPPSPRPPPSPPPSSKGCVETASQPSVDESVGGGELHQARRSGSGELRAVDARCRAHASSVLSSSSSTASSSSSASSPSFFSSSLFSSSSSSSSSFSPSFSPPSLLSRPAKTASYAGRVSKAGRGSATTVAAAAAAGAAAVAATRTAMTTRTASAATRTATAATRGPAAQAQRRDLKNNTEKARRTTSTVWLQEMQSRLEAAGWAGSRLSQANHRKSKGLLKYNKLEIMENFVGSFDEMMREIREVRTEGDGLRGDNLRLRARNGELRDEIARLNGRP